MPYPSEADPITKMGKKIVAARDLSAGHTLDRERPRAEVAGRRRLPPVRARRGDRPHAAPPGRRGRGLHVRRPRGADPRDGGGCVPRATPMTRASGRPPRRRHRSARKPRAGLDRGARRRRRDAWSGSTCAPARRASVAGATSPTAPALERRARRAIGRARGARQQRRHRPAARLAASTYGSRTCRWRLRAHAGRERHRRSTTRRRSSARRCATAGGGSIVNIGSLYASIAPIPALLRPHRDPPFLKPAAYGASKAAVAQPDPLLRAAVGARTACA